MGVSDTQKYSTQVKEPWKFGRRATATAVVVEQLPSTTRYWVDNTVRKLPMAFGAPKRRGVIASVHSRFATGLAISLPGAR